MAHGYVADVICAVCAAFYAASCCNLLRMVCHDTACAVTVEKKQAHDNDPVVREQRERRASREHTHTHYTHTHTHTGLVHTRAPSLVHTPEPRVHSQQITVTRDQ